MALVSWMLYLARRVGPETVETVRKYGVELAKNPEVASAVRNMYVGVRSAQQGRSPSQRLRRTINVIQVKAVQVQGRASDDELRERADGWVSRCESLLHAVDLLDVEAGGRRRQDLKTIRAEVDALMAEVLAALVSAPQPVDAVSPPPTLPSDGDGPADAPPSDDA